MAASEEAVRARLREYLALRQCVLPCELLDNHECLQCRQVNKQWESAVRGYRLDSFRKLAALGFPFAEEALRVHQARQAPQSSR